MPVFEIERATDKLGPIPRTASYFTITMLLPKSCELASRSNSNSISSGGIVISHILDGALPDRDREEPQRAGVIDYLKVRLALGTDNYGSSFNECLSLSIMFGRYGMGSQRHVDLKAITPIRPSASSVRRGSESSRQFHLPLRVHAQRKRSLIPNLNVRHDSVRGVGKSRQRLMQYLISLISHGRSFGWARDALYRPTACVL